MDSELKQQISNLIERPLTEEGYELAEVVLSRFKANVTLRLSVYGEKGVTLEACARLSRMVSELIEETEMFKDGFALEVSSPGLDRPLTTVRDFKFRVGEKVRITFADRKRKKVAGEIVSVSDGAVEFRNDDGEFSVPFEEIEKARIIY